MYKIEPVLILIIIRSLKLCRVAIYGHVYEVTSS